jgi:cysteinyl-tRNA synthetase
MNIYNSLSRKKEKFEPINPPYVGLYVCGPTVYGDAHLGHARPAVTFDLLFRYLKYLGYKVRYVRNITDVGHLENDADEGEDKIAKKARLEQLEPMEVVQHYTIGYHHNMEQLNVLPPSIEPRASGHIIEQIEIVNKIIDAGFAYQSGGSVYFDLKKYTESHEYGQLSGRKIDDLLSQTRSLDGQDEKRFPLDFALWKKASDEHIMRWTSPWSDGFPGWHLECTAMSARYLGQTFDIHGGGMDLLFPHHECEIAQSVAAFGQESVKYWMHNNMITINNQKMGKSYKNFITLDELFAGTHKLLEKAYSPMTIRFFILQAHYRSTLDFGNEALQASEKGLQRLMAGVNTLNKLKPANSSTISFDKLEENCKKAMEDDLNSPVAIAHLFDGLRVINLVYDGKEHLTKEDIERLKNIYHTFVFDIFGLKDENTQNQTELISGLVDYIVELRQEAKQNKDFATSDKIRNMLKDLGIEIKDRKDGVDWEISG